MDDGREADRQIAALVSELRNWYWQLRALRVHNAYRRRTIYRRIRALRLELLKFGVDPMELHTYCLKLTRYGMDSDVREERWMRQVVRQARAGRKVVTVLPGQMTGG